MSFFVRSLEARAGRALSPTVRLPDGKVYTASAYLQVSTTEFGIWQWSRQSNTKRTTMGKHWQLIRLNQL